MEHWGTASTKERATIDPRLNEVSDVVVQVRNHSIIKGHRNKIEQDIAFNSEPQTSKLAWPDGKHNGLPSKALDMQPYPMPDSHQTLREDLSYLAGLYVGIGRAMGYEIRWGGDWDRDGETFDNAWDDLFHVELIE